MNKDLIHNRFAKNLKSYDENAKIQKRMAEKLVTYIDNREHKKILELGCGTGFLTKLITNNINFESYKTIDIVENCKEYIEQINPEIEFIHDDIENFIENNIEKYDLIISNASLQWVDDFEKVINSLKKFLNKDGELIFSTFGLENFREIYHIVGTSLKYYSISELQKMFPNSIIEPEIHIMAFESPKEVLRHLQQTGVNAIVDTKWTKTDLIKFENGYENICSRRPTLTYNPIYIKILSPVG